MEDFTLLQQARIKGLLSCPAAAHSCCDSVKPCMHQFTADGSLTSTRHSRSLPSDKSACTVERLESRGGSLNNAALQQRYLQRQPYGTGLKAVFQSEFTRFSPEATYCGKDAAAFFSGSRLPLCQGSAIPMLHGDNRPCIHLHS